MNYLTIQIAYQWGDEAQYENLKWLFLREMAEKVAEEVETHAAKKGANITVNVSRLRARHGCMVLPEIQKRIEEAGALLFDLGDDNPNVYIELGMALQSKNARDKIFVLRKENQKTPSDIAGMLFTEYCEEEDYKLVDARGFRAALKGVLIRQISDQL